MKFFLIFMTAVLLLLSEFANANNYLSYYLTSDGEKTIHHISKINPKNGELSYSFRLGKATNEISLVYTNSDSKLIAIYLKSEQENDNLVVLNKESLELVSKIQIRKHDSSTSKDPEVFSVFISKDDKKITIFSADNKKSVVNIFNSRDGDNLYNKEIKGHSFKVTRTKDLNYIAIEYTKLKNRILRVIDINNLQTSALQNLGLNPAITHLFNDTIMISSEKPHPRATQYKLSKVDIKTNEVIKYQDLSLKPFIMVNDKDQNEMFIVGRNTKKKKDLFVIRMDKTGGFSKTNYKKKSNPLNAVLNANNTRLMVIGESKLSTINLDNNSLQSRIRIPFDPLDGIINKDGSIGYVQENNGSQVGNFDLVSGELIEQSSAGRFLKQVLVNSRKTVLKVLIVGLVPSVIETLFSWNNSNKNILLSNDESQLLVINATTNDLSVFDALTLKKQSSKGTGSKTFFMSQGPSENSPILIIGKNKLSIFNHKNNTLLLSLKNAKLIGLDKPNDLLFYNLNNALHIYDMKNNKKLSQTNSFNPIAIYVF